ncbi:hypothetical protein DDB_G0291107 [Dictyostelium discoideum AX4]|uniref:PQ-loop repeat-containing protein n=1 Tax=Dictyostelium discoideum TaxID=44689 RepID=Q54F66_DICDI|nr:hypothetical protein DDB_G0291107 [Dictyostelium discoideum AX4]EAL61901.1 hypothetical protein DDB_G0291107 [Dictyostelium discoideum AX4]|eukprot:XP_635388.1 hypothetical protein DDB_G0291107 [Dictyostelium discoideum AX4]
MENKILSNLFGIVGTILWSVQLVPQIHLNYKRKSTKGVSPTCFGCWYACGVILGTNLVFNREPPALVVQISCFSLFSLVIVMQHLFYQKKYNLKRLLFTIGLCVLVTIATIISLYSILNAKHTNSFVLQLILTIAATGLMAVGFFPQILEVYQEKVGLSMIFVVMDFFGGVFSILSLVFHVPFDYMSFSTYVVVPICQAIIFGLVMRINLKSYRENGGLSSRVGSPFVPFENVEVDLNEITGGSGSGGANKNNNCNDDIEANGGSGSNNEEFNNNNNNNNGGILLNKKGKGSGSGSGGGANDDEENHSTPLINGSSHHHHFIRESNTIIPSSTFMISSNDDNAMDGDVGADNVAQNTHNNNNSSGGDGGVDTPLSSSNGIPKRQELDHIIPLSISNTAELLKQQQHQQQLSHQQQLVDESITQLKNNIIHNQNQLNNLNNQNYHGYPVS